MYMSWNLQGLPILAFDLELECHWNVFTKEVLCESINKIHLVETKLCTSHEIY